MENNLIIGNLLLKVSNLKASKMTWNKILSDYMEDFAQTAMAKEYWKKQVERQVATLKKWFLSRKMTYYHNLTREKARDYISWRGKKSASTINKELLRIRAIIKFAERFLKQAPNYAFDNINVPQTSENTRFVTPLSIEECKNILKWAKKYPYFHDTLLLMLITGMENKAISNIKREWWHLKENLLFVFPQKISGVIDAKTQHRARKIPITKTMKAIYDRGYIFSDSASRFNQKCQRLFMKCSLETGIENVHCHRFRHSFASQALSAGFDIVRVSKMLGHKNINITLKHYADFMLSESIAGFEGMIKVHKEWMSYLNTKYFDI